MGFVKRGLAFPYWLWERLTEISEDRNWTVNKVVNDAVLKYVAESLSGEDLEKFQLLAEENKLLAENERLFTVMKRVLRDGAYINDAAKCVILGDENFYERWQKKAEGLYNRLTKDELDFLLRIFAAREKNTARIVEIERKLLPEDRLAMERVEEGWRLSLKKRAKKND